MEAHAGIQERAFTVPDRFDAVCHRWTMEGNNIMATAGWAYAYQQAETKHTGDYRADADPASAGDGGGRNTCETRKKERSATRLLFDFGLRHDARSSPPSDV